jgi:hypothetical protein
VLSLCVRCIDVITVLHKCSSEPDTLSNDPQIVFTPDRPSLY